MPPDFRAELIGGVVFVPSRRVTIHHGHAHACLAGWLGDYRVNTPGVESLISVTVLLGDDSEPQPDLCHLVDWDCGGQTRDVDGYLAGPPELILEVATSTAAIDLHAKRRDYERWGVQEYLVFVPLDQRLMWFVRRRGRFEAMLPGPDGIYRSRVFPGLWLDPEALFRSDGAALRATVDLGAASPEHQRFVRRLAVRRAGAAGQKEPAGPNE